MSKHNQNVNLRTVFQLKHQNHNNNNNNNKIHLLKPLKLRPRPQIMGPVAKSSRPRLEKGPINAKISKISKLINEDLIHKLVFIQKSSKRGEIYRFGHFFFHLFCLRGLSRSSQGHKRWKAKRLLERQMRALQLKQPPSSLLGGGEADESSWGLDGGDAEARSREKKRRGSEDCGH